MYNTSANRGRIGIRIEGWELFLTAEHDDDRNRAQTTAPSAIKRNTRSTGAKERLMLAFKDILKARGIFRPFEGSFSRRSREVLYGEKKRSKRGT